VGATFVLVFVSNRVLPNFPPNLPVEHDSVNLVVNLATPLVTHVQEVVLCQLFFPVQACLGREVVQCVRDEPSTLVGRQAHDVQANTDGCVLGQGSAERWRLAPVPVVQGQSHVPDRDWQAQRGECQSASPVLPLACLLGMHPLEEAQY
jgi:hypothetical protein